jgi:hypothetical protein
MPAESAEAIALAAAATTVDFALSLPVTKDARRDKALRKGGALEALMGQQKTGEQR